MRISCVLILNFIITLSLVSCVGRVQNSKNEFDVDSVSRNTKLYNKNSHKFIESQKFPINSSKTNYYSLMKYKDKKGTEIYKIIYTYTGIWTQSVNVNNNPAQKDLIFQDSIDGRLLEIMTIEIEESIIRSLNDINISVIGRGSGSIETIHGFAKYDINEFSFNVPGAILCGFLQKADLLPLE